MNSQKIIKELRELRLKDLDSLISNISSYDSYNEVLYQANQIIFQSSSIGHKKRLSLLKKVNKLASKYKNNCNEIYNDMILKKHNYDVKSYNSNIPMINLNESLTFKALIKSNNL